MTNVTSEKRVTEYDTMRGILITIPAESASPAARQNAVVTLTAEDGESISLPFKHVRHLVQALQLMLDDEGKRL